MSDTPTLRAAIAAVRAKGLVAVKTARNTGINSDYASYADVWSVLKPELEEHRLSVGFLLGPVRRDDSAWVQTLTMEVCLHADFRSFPFEFTFPEGNRGVNLSQRQGMAQTYARRYALVSFFHIITGDDDDAQRLGQDSRSEAVQPKADAHWSSMCFAPALEVGHEETQQGYGMLADPEGDGDQTLGDLSSKALGERCFRHVEHVGLIAWTAELANDRALKLKLTTWAGIRQFAAASPGRLQLPESARDCTGDQLRQLAQALKQAK